MSMPDLATAIAPKPLLLVSASEDPWTNSTPDREFPMIRSFFELLGAGDSIRNFHTNAGHNFNPDSRKAVYEWMAKHLSPEARIPANIPGPSPEVASLGDLRVFPDHLLPESAKSGRDVVAEWIETSSIIVEESIPDQKDEYSGWTSKTIRKLALLLAMQRPEPGDFLYRVEKEEVEGDLIHRVEKIRRKGRSDWFRLESIGREEEEEDTPGVALLVYPEAFGRLIDSDGTFVRPWIKALIERGIQIYRVRGYASGNLRIPPEGYDSWSHSAAYNRSNQLNGIQDTITALSSIREAYPDEPLMLVGLGESGLLASFAAAIHGGPSRIVLDLNQSDPGYDRELLELLPVTSIRRIGDIRTALLLSASKKITIFNSGPNFDRDWHIRRFQALGFEENLEFTTNETSVSFAGLD
jgi:hypothetical protein